MDLEREYQEFKKKFFSLDAVLQVRACTEFLKKIHNLGVNDIDVKCYNLYRLTEYLLFIGRKDDVERNVEWMKQQPSITAQMEWRRSLVRLYEFEQNTEKLGEILNEMMEYTECFGDDNSYMCSVVEYVKHLCNVGQYEKSIEYASKCQELAIVKHHIFFYLLSEYYMGISLVHLGHEDLGLEKLRIVSDMAFDKRYKEFIMHSEPLRAAILIEKGRIEEAREILNQWRFEFSTSL